MLVEKDDVEAAARQSHSIKGAAANVGGEEMRAVAAAMEAAGRVKDMNGIRTRLADLESSYAQLEETMRQAHVI